MSHDETKMAIETIMPHDETKMDIETPSCRMTRPK